MNEEDSCPCCNNDFVAFEQRVACGKCGNKVCGKCIRKGDAARSGAESPQHNTEVHAVCKDCEFMGKWMTDVKSKDKGGKFWNIRMPKLRLRRNAGGSSTRDTTAAEKKMPNKLNQKFSMVASMIENNSNVAQAAPVLNMADIQENLQALSREKLKEIHDQKKLISELQEENARMRGNESIKVMLDDLKKESETHINQLEQQIQMLLEQNARLKQTTALQVQSVVATAAVQAAPPAEDPKFAKYRKMHKTGLPEGAILQAAGRDGVELPAAFFSEPAPVAAALAAPAQAAPVVQEDPKFAKYRKMQKAGLPEGAILQAASRDGVELAATFFSGPMQEARAAAPAVPAVPTVPAAAEEDPKFAKYRKMQKAGLPEGAISQAAGRDGVILPANWFAGPVAAPAPAAAAAQDEDPKFAKYRKMQKAGLPDGAIVQAASRDGVQLPSSFFGGAAPPPPPALAGGLPKPPALGGLPKPPTVIEVKAPSSPKSKYDTPRKQVAPVVDSSKVRGIFWNVLPAKRVENSLWTTLSDSPPFPIDSQLRELEALFTKTATATKVAALSPANKGKSDKPERAPLLDGKRQQNLGIALARFKEPIEVLKQHILEMNSDFFTMESVHKLLGICPSPEEIQAIQAAESEWSGSPRSFVQDLCKEELFVYEMSKVPRMRQRLQAVFVEMSFERQSEILHESIAKYEAGIRQLNTCKEWRTLLHLCLVAGNFLNTGNKSTAGAWGIEISTGLQKLSEAKSPANPKYSLLHWVAEVADVKAPSLFGLVEKLDKLEEASALRIEDLKADLAQLTKGCELVERELKACANNPSAPGAKAFVHVLKPFMEESGEPVIRRLTASMESLEAQAKKLLDDHGELPSKCSASQLLSTAQKFCVALCKAREEIQLIKVLETKKKQAEEGKQEPIAPALASTSKQLEKQMKADDLGRKLSDSFKKRGTRTADTQAGISNMLAKLKPSNGVQSA